MKKIIPIIIVCLSIHAFSSNYMPGYPDYKPLEENHKTSTENIYPDINSSGFIEMKVSGRDYSDDINKLETIRNDEYYKKIPNDIMKGSLKLENRYDIQLEGKLDKDTEVRYSIQKEPDFPGVYNVYIRKDKSELQFGDFKTQYSAGEYINIEKYLNGVEANTVQNNWKAKATLGKEKSEPQKFETYGNGTKAYKLGKTFILQGSVIIYVNNKELKENRDYTVNYFDGTIQFNQILTKVDYIKIIYEFTNPIQDFVPSLSRKNFTAINYTYSPSQNTKIDELSITTKNEIIKVDKESQIIENRINLSKYPIKLGSESIHLNNKLLTRGVHYYLKNDSGLIRFIQKQIGFDDEINAIYQFYETDKEQGIQLGNGSPGPYYLKHKYPIKESIKVKLGNIEAKEFIDYIYSSQTNSIEFYYSVYRNKTIQISYDYKKYTEKELASNESDFSLSVTHIDESTSVRDDISTFRENYPPSEIKNNNQVIVLQDSPIDKSKDSFISVVINGEEIDASDYTIDYYKGEITLSDPSSIESFNLNDVKVSYYYLTSLYTEHSIQAYAGLTYTHTQHIRFRPIPVKNNGIEKITIWRNSEKIELDPDEDSETIESIIYQSDETLEEFKDVTVKFKLGNNSKLDTMLTNDDQIKFSYYYTPNPGDTEAESSHSLTDVLAQQKITKNWKIISEIANTKYRYSKTSKQNKETFNTTQDDNKYILEFSPLVQDSEMVFINGFPQTRYNDYDINYEEGTVTIRGATIPNGESVEILYDYYLTDTPNNKDVNAYSVVSEYYPIDSVSIKNKVNIVDPNFMPIGNINIKKGSSKYSHEINWNMNQNEQLTFLHEDEKIQNNKYEDLLKKQIFQTDLKLNIQQFITSHQIRYENTTATANYNETSKKIVKYDNKISLNLNEDKVSLISNISQKNEKLSNSNDLNSLVGGTKLEYVNNFTINNFINSGDIIPYAGITIDKTNTKNTNNYSKQVIDSYGLTSKASFNQFFNSTNSFDKSTYRTYYFDNRTFNDPYYNYSSLSNFNPFNWLSTNGNISHEESISPIPGQENKVETRKGINIGRLSNDAGLEYLKFPTFLQDSFRGSFTTLGYLNTNRRENNALKRFLENRLYGSLNSWKPFNGFSIPKIKTDASLSESLDKQDTSYQLNNKSRTKLYSIETGFNYKPNAKILNRFLFDGKLNYSNSNSKSELLLVSGTENITESLRISDTQSYGVNINLPDFPILISNIKKPTLRLERKWKIEVDENTTDSTDNTLDNSIIDNSSVSANVYSLNYKVFKSINSKNTALNEQSYYNRNRIENATGSLFKHIMNIDQQISSKLFSNISNTEYFKFERLEQFKQPTINITSNSLRNNYENYLKIDERIASHESKLSISNFLSLTGKAEYQDFTQKINSGNATINNSFYNQKTGTSGLILTPLSGLKLTYNYSIKQLSINHENSQKGNQDLIQVSYNPIKYDNFSIQLDISREKNWGFGFNTIAKDQLLQTTNETLSIDVIERDDTIYLGSLNLNITLPINNSEHLEKIIFTTEGYFKKIVDNVDNNNSIMINGLLFNVRMEL